MVDHKLIKVEKEDLHLLDKAKIKLLESGKATNNQAAVKAALEAFTGVKNE